ncbi:hypothetical protein ASD24_24455 [Paenibacillus sp. Root52]|uniref:YgiT-type zinc finger protein n=1 Tax=Paenibacillus sp. Root52 TaxID=1736552 RepID=UPI0006F472EF|nr:YgiT-type zinc finger protein [Paenibacillus sp. Root52]KQY90952.1 hypothetical protein ASD24_24455 [Paenibacillus sp. Root52]
MDVTSFSCGICRGKLVETTTTMELPIKEDKKVEITDLPALKCTACGDTYLTPTASRLIDRKLQYAILSHEIQELEEESRSCSKDVYDKLLLKIEIHKKEMEKYMDNSEWQ